MVTTKQASNFIPFDVLFQTLEVKRYSINVFLNNLCKLGIDHKEIETVISLYRLGTVASGTRAGAITFPFIDIQDNINAIQVKQFDSGNQSTGTNYLHSIIYDYCINKNKPLPIWLEAFNKGHFKASCLFGEHLLMRYPQNPVALVEAPKTAIYGALYYGLPKSEKEPIWLATAYENNFSLKGLKPLEGRTTTVFPNLSKDGRIFKEWQDKAGNIETHLPETKFIFNDLLERTANDTEREKGLNLADFLIRLDWEQFRNPTKATQQSFIPFEEYILSLSFENGILIADRAYPAEWDSSTNVKYIDDRTKKFIGMAAKNPIILDLANKFRFN